MTAASAPARHAPIALWRIAEFVLSALHGLFGGPGDLAAAHTLTAKTHKLASTWLRAAEALMRRLLQIEAAAYAPTSAPRPRAGLRPERAKRFVEHHAHDPDSWRVSFHFCTDSQRRAGQHQRRSTRARRLRLGLQSAWPLAERYEALIRVFNEPVRFAKPLAQRLSAAPERARDILADPEEPRQTIGPDFDIVQSAATQAAPHHPDSS